MAQSKSAAGHSLAASLQPLLRSRKAELSVGELMARIEGQDGPGPILFALTLPVLLPLPPGVSMLFALPLLMIAPQIAIGRRHLWMPSALSGRKVKRAELGKLLHRVLPPLKRVEAVVRPRLGFLAGGLGARMVGVAATLIAIVLVLPIPFANFAPAVALGLFSLGLSRRDGLFVLAGYAVMALAVLIVVLGVEGASLGIARLRTLI